MQNWLVGILAVVSLLAGFAYITLGLRANDHLNGSASKQDRSIGWLFWWSFDTDKYDDEGKRLCRAAQGLAFLIIALLVGWNWLLIRPR